MNHSDQDFDHLLVAVTEGTLTAEEKKRLNQYLMTNPERVDDAVRFMMQDDLLRTQLSEEANQLSLEKDLPILPVCRRRGPGWRWWVGAAAALVAVFFVSRRPDGSSREEEAAASFSHVQSTRSPVAALTRGYGLSMAVSEFEEGDYQIEHGTAEIMFRNGVEIILDAPADFTIESEMKMVLREGRVRARVPEQAIGFTIDAPDLDIVDLGTEFGVYVERDQKTEVHVFSGEVELHEKNGSPASARVIKEGVAENWVNGKVSKLLPHPDTDSFPSSSEIGYRRWRQHQKTLRKDPSLQVMWDFQGGSEREDVVLNRQGNHLYQGYIRGAKRVNGRWANKKALLFDGPKDRVNINLPVEFSELTLSAWIKADSFQSPVVALLNANGLPPGAVHWQLRDRGGLRVSAQSVFYGSTDFPHIRTGEWTHVAMTYNASKRRLRAYVNGEVVMKRKAYKSDPVIFGKANLGHWSQSTFWPYNRDFKGRVGELLIFDAEKSPGELSAIYETGRP